MRAVAAVALVAALGLPATALGAKPARNYAGQAATGAAVGFKATPAEVRGFAIGYEARCDDGETLRGTFRFKPAKLKDGRWSVNGPGSGRLPDGRTTASRLRLSGELTARRARGAFSITTQMARLDGGGVATCRSGRVTWKAARQ